jgi:hypothetical protein
MTSGSLSRAGRPGRRVDEGWLAFHQSSIWTYNETRKESRSIMEHRLWEKVRCQHKLSAPSSPSAITHQTSKFNYYLDESDPDIVILRRQDASFVAAFSAWGVTKGGLIDAAKEDYRELLRIHRP